MRRVVNRSDARPAATVRRSSMPIIYCARTGRRNSSSQASNSMPASRRLGPWRDRRRARAWAWPVVVPAHLGRPNRRSTACALPRRNARRPGEFEGEAGKCPAGNGLCLAPEPEVRLSSPIPWQTKVTGIRGFVDVAFRYLISISVVVAGIMFVYAGFTLYHELVGHRDRQREGDDDECLWLAYSCYSVR